MKASVYKKTLSQDLDIAEKSISADVAVSVSIIVPVYNAANTIERCVESVRKQSFTRWQLILVDDGSTDDTYSVCKGFEQEDSRILVLRKENGGVSSARNAGISEATGTWIMFIDADDFIESDYLDKMLRATERSGNEAIAMVRSNHKNMNGENVSIHGINPVDGVCSVEEDLESIFVRYRLLFMVTCWAKLFRRDILKNHNLRFVETIPVLEDYCFVLSYIKVLRGFNASISFSLADGYCHQTGDANSLSSRKFTFEEHLNILEEVGSCECNFAEGQQYSTEIMQILFKACYIKFVETSKVAGSYRNFKRLRKKTSDLLGKAKHVDATLIRKINLFYRLPVPISYLLLNVVLTLKHLLRK